VKSGLKQTDTISDRVLSGLLLPAKAIAVRALYKLMFFLRLGNMHIRTCFCPGGA
jgi:hypothetical protein